MGTKIFKATVLAAFLLLVAPPLTRPARAQESKAPYPAMAALDQYLIADRDAEIALAKSAAPPALANDASVPSTARISGTPNCADPSATTRQPCAPSSPTPFSGQS